MTEDPTKAHVAGRAWLEAAHRAWRRHRLSRLDLLGVVVGTVYAIPSLGYPFGRDQALHHYIGRWWLEGYLPYRDALDNKPAGVYLIYALTSTVFGSSSQVGIRAFDLAATIAVGVLAVLAIPGATRPARGEWGAGVIVACGIYYTCFDYWDTAQSDHWQSVAILASYVVAARLPLRLRGAVISGALAGVAFVCKFTAAPIALGIFAVWLGRAMAAGGHGRARLLATLRIGGAFCAAAAAPITLLVAYFAAKGALHDAIEVMVDYTIVYVANWQVPEGIGAERASYFWLHHAFVPAVLVLVAWLLGVVPLVRRRAWVELRGPLIASGLLALSVWSVSMQGKFFPYHWAATSPFLTLCVAWGVSAHIRKHPRLVTTGVGVCLALTFFSAPPWISQIVAGTTKPATYANISSSFWSYVTGMSPRREYLQNFRGILNYSYMHQEILGLILRARATKQDRLLVRGFEPAIYTVAGLRAPTRFAADFAVTDSRLTYGRERWSAEYERDCWTNPPRFVVTFGANKEDRAFLEARGYSVLALSGQFVAYER